LLVCGIFISDGPKLVRILIVLLGAVASVAILYLWYKMDEGPWYLFLPLFLYATAVGSLAIRQLVNE
ncbi:hypothetical protein MJD09_15125, partial [bacterium]|nr:hypothetical protein [bacterium]